MLTCCLCVSSLKSNWALSVFVELLAGSNIFIVHGSMSELFCRIFMELWQGIVLNVLVFCHKMLYIDNNFNTKN